MRSGRRVALRGEARGAKRLFLLLASVSVALLLVVLWLVFFLLEPRMASVGPGLVEVSRVVIVFAGLAAVVVVASDLLSAALSVRLIPGSVGQRIAIHFLLPVSERLGRLAGVPPDRVKAAFIDFNNALLKARLDRGGRGAGHALRSSRSRKAAGNGESAACCGWVGASPEDVGPGSGETVRGSGGAGPHATSRGVLLLLPHCLQSSECSRVLGEDVLNCGECGNCEMSELKGLVPKYGVRNRIVGGGALALTAVRELRPRAIVGVACERELVAAIKELRGVPIMAIPNSRPDGPCRNTRVDVSLVDEALRILLKQAGSHCNID